MRSKEPPTSSHAERYFTRAVHASHTKVITQSRENPRGRRAMGREGFAERRRRRSRGGTALRRTASQNRKPGMDSRDAAKMRPSTWRITRRSMRAPSNFTRDPSQWTARGSLASVASRRSISPSGVDRSASQCPMRSHRPRSAATYRTPAQTATAFPPFGETA